MADVKKIATRVSYGETLVELGAEHNDPETYEFELGRAIVMREGTDVSIVACGLMVSAALEAAWARPCARLCASTLRSA